MHLNSFVKGQNKKIENIVPYEKVRTINYSNREVNLGGRRTKCRACEGDMGEGILIQEFYL